ncbi:hypothetical protein ACFP1Z_33310 [Streptomyces gamaensis]|uniref:GNAT family N-acetyltransferase n=1 Tax=Streptomyces gamaensis TaxID=1763542 RepID=A0ABW0ZAZ1_9ACTN
MSVRAPQRWRAPRRVIAPAPDRTDLDGLAARASLARQDPGPADLLPVSADVVDSALSAGLRTGFLGGPWRDGFPRYAWHCASGADGVRVLEFRLTGRVPGEYAGYELHPSEWPEGLSNHVA